VLVGKTLTSVVVAEGGYAIDFICDNGETFQAYHEQDCCESVEVEEIVGDLADIIGSPILIAEEVESHDKPEGRAEPKSEALWTFYKIDTAKGGVTIRWCGESNGYYSMSVNFRKVTEGAM
jgi:hypothetical protein